MTSAAESVGVVVVGASVAAGSLVTALRADGYDRPVVAVDSDPDAPYDRPPLSKQFLTSDDVQPDAAWWSGGCELVHGRAVGLHPSDPIVAVESDGTRRNIRADHVVVASGSEPVRLAGLPPEVRHLRTARDARALRTDAVDGARVVILGAGTIGTEVASSLTVAGAHVTLIDLVDRPLDRLLAGHLSEEVGAWVREAGVRLWLGTAVESVHFDGDRFAVRTDAAGRLDADLVLSAVGTRPDVDWLSTAGLDVGDGVRCDAHGTALTTYGRPRPGIHAIGDASAWIDENGKSTRHQDWTSAQRQGRDLARRILGLEPAAPVQELPYFWTHQFGRRVQILGTPTRDAGLITEMWAPERQAAFHTLVGDDGSRAWIAVNAPREFAGAMRESMTTRHAEAMPT